MYLSNAICWTLCLISSSLLYFKELFHTILSSTTPVIGYTYMWCNLYAYVLIGVLIFFSFFFFLIPHSCKLVYIYVSVHCVCATYKKLCIIGIRSHLTIWFHYICSMCFPASFLFYLYVYTYIWMLIYQYAFPPDWALPCFWWYACDMIYI